MSTRRRWDDVQIIDCSGGDWNEEREGEVGRVRRKLITCVDARDTKGLAKSTTFYLLMTIDIVNYRLVVASKITGGFACINECRVSTLISSSN